MFNNDPLDQSLIRENFKETDSEWFVVEQKMNEK